MRNWRADGPLASTMLSKPVVPWLIDRPGSWMGESKESGDLHGFGQPMWIMGTGTGHS